MPDGNNPSSPEDVTPVSTTDGAHGEILDSSTLFTVDRGKTYKEFWTNVSTDWSNAVFAVVGTPFDREASSDTLKLSGEPEAKILAQKLHLGPESRVLEIGAGVGRIGCHLTKIAGHYTGSDISSNMLEIARTEMGDAANVDLVELPEAEPLPFADNSFDAVFSQAVFIHLDREDCYRYMQEAARVTRPGGRVYFQFYNLLHPEGFDLFEWVSANTVTKDGKVRGRVHFLTAPEVRAYMSGAGLTIDETQSHLETVDQRYDYPLPMLNYDYYLIAVGTVPGKPEASLLPTETPLPPSDSYCDHYISGFIEKLARVTSQIEELETLRSFLEQLPPVEALCCTHSIERGALDAARHGVDPNILIPALHRASSIDSNRPLAEKITDEIRAAIVAVTTSAPEGAGG